MGELDSPLWVCNREEFTRLFGGEIGNPLWVCIRGIEGGLAGRWGDGKEVILLTEDCLALWEIVATRKGEIGREIKEIRGMHVGSV